MANQIAGPRVPAVGSLSPSNLGLVGQLATSWGVAGGLMGAAVVTAHMVAGNVSSSIGFLTATIFYVAGSLVGFLHGGIVGYLGRPENVTRQRALRRLALAALYAVPAMLLGWAVALSLALTAVGIVARRPALLAPALIGWIGLAAAVSWAVVEARLALAHLCRRWPGARAALTLLVLAFLALLPFFLVARPPIWVVGVRPTETAAVFMAGAATLWIGGPLAAIGVLAVRAWRKRHPQRG